MPDTIIDDIAALKVAVAKLQAPTIAITTDQIVQALRSLLLGTTAVTPPATGGAVSSTTDANTYPLTMPNVAAAGAVALGTGPDTIDLLISNSPSQPAPCEFDVILTRTDGSQVGVAGPLICTSYVGQTSTGAQHFSLKGPWGANPKFVIAPAQDAAGVSGMFLMGAAINLVPMGIWGAVNSRGGDAGGSPWAYNSNNGAMTLQLAGNAPPTGSVAPPAWKAVPTQINGKTLDQMAGGTLPAQTIIGTARLTSDLTGAGIGQTIIDGTDLEPKEDKALLVVGAPLTISDLTVRKAWVPGGLGLNAAGIRNETGLVPLTVRRVELTGNQNGIMTQGDSVGPFLIENSHVHENGDLTHPEDTHNLYLGGKPEAVATLNNNVIENSTDVHEVKSRCGTLNATGNTIKTGGNGSCYDLPNGGIFNATNETWTLSANASDRNFLTFGMENNLNAAIGAVVTLTNILFDDLTGLGGLLQCLATNFPNAVINLIGCTYRGAVAPQFIGWSKVVGEVLKVA